MSETIVKKPGDFCWVELISTDLDNALSFYTHVFGWKAHRETSDDGDYIMLQVGEHTIAGAMSMPEDMRSHNIPQHWNSYVLVDDVEKSAKQAKSLGAKILKEPFDVMGMGKMTIFTDPTGAVLCLWQSHKKMEPTLPPTAPGTFGWNELLTNDADKAKSFYENCFGWQSHTETMPTGKVYTSFKNQQQEIAGMFTIGDDMPGVSPHWHVYFTVANLKETLDKAVKRGGEICFEPKKVEGVGEFTTIKDPQNGYFAVIQYS